MLREALKFFSNILDMMYPAVKDNLVAPDTIVIDKKQEVITNSQLLERLTSLNNEVRELVTKIDNQS